MMLKGMWKLAAGILAAGTAAAAGAQEASPAIEMWRLDCGEVHFTDIDVFSDTYLYPGQPKTLVASCYLIRNGDRYLLWDTGLPGSLAGSSREEGGTRQSLRRTIVDQLAEIGVSPDQITFLGISHHHYDHIGQAADFPGALLRIGFADWNTILERPNLAAQFGPWIAEDGTGKENAGTMVGDHDVFGDGRVIMLKTPGHTDGHHALLVRLPESGPVLLTGDLYHFTENATNRGVPSFNVNRADTLASMDRFDRLAENLGARIIIQHEPDDVAKLPAFPLAAR